jgi:hypothetical protein
MRKLAVSTLLPADWWLCIRYKSGMDTVVTALVRHPTRRLAKVRPQPVLERCYPRFRGRATDYP